MRGFLPAPEHLVLDGVDETEGGVIARVRSKETPRCPACAGSQVSDQSSYHRTLRDSPWQGKPVQRYGNDSPENGPHLIRLEREPVVVRSRSPLAAVSGPY